MSERDHEPEAPHVVDTRHVVTTEDLEWLRSMRQDMTPQRRLALMKVADAHTVLQYLGALLLALIAIVGLPTLGKGISWMLDKLGAMR